MKKLDKIEKKDPEVKKMKMENAAEARKEAERIEKLKKEINSIEQEYNKKDEAEK